MDTRKLDPAALWRAEVALAEVQQVPLAGEVLGFQNLAGEGEGDYLDALAVLQGQQLLFNTGLVL